MTRSTYWHLESQGRMPSDYEVVTSRLLYYPEHGVEVPSPVAQWCREQHAHAALRYRDWEQFSDPRQTTYSTYVEQAQAREAFIDGLLEVAETTGYDEKLSQEWLATLDAVVPVLRFPVHGLQMVSAHIGSMAPSGRIVVTSLFQAADEMRLVQRLAYRTRMLQGQWLEFGASSRRAWEAALPWQPLRRSIEQLLVTYDWTAALLVSSLVVKPLIKELFLVQFAKLAAAAGDELLDEILSHLAEDQSWHESWSTALLADVLQDDANHARAAEIILAQRPCVVSIVDHAALLFHESKPMSGSVDREAMKEAVHAALLQRQRAVGLTP